MEREWYLLVSAIISIGIHLDGRPFEIHVVSEVRAAYIFVDT